MDLGQKQAGSNAELYTLKHKDLDVAVVQVDRRTGMIEYVLEVYMPEELPVGCLLDGSFVREWWRERAIPDSRRGIQQVRNYFHEQTNQSLMLSGYGLSLTDHYWMQPLDREAYWKDINYFENVFTDRMGDLLTETGSIDMEQIISRFSPSSSVNGEMKKKWIIRDDIRYLMKVSFNFYGQQAVNERIACRLHELTGWPDYAHYELKMVHADEKIFPCSLSRLFTSNEAEFVSAYQLVRNYKVRNEASVYEEIIRLAAENGLEEEAVRRQLEYTIQTDFLMSNTDRHFNNFGFLKASESGRFVGMAPIFDTGNSLFFDQELIPSGERLLEIQAASFRKREADMLLYLKGGCKLDLQALSGFSEDVFHILTESTDMPSQRAEQIAAAVRQKMAYLDQFYNGKKEKYR